MVATSEYPGGIIVDPHNLIAFESYPFDNEPWDADDGWHSITNPSHETFGDDGIIWSTAATFRISQDENGMPTILESKVCKLKHYVAVMKN